VIRLDIWDHSTHWITALRYVGFRRPEENGFAIRCQPKSVVTREQFKLQLEAEKHQEFSQGHTEQNDNLPPTGTN